MRWGQPYGRPAAAKGRRDRHHAVRHAQVAGCISFARRIPARVASSLARRRPVSYSQGVDLGTTFVATAIAGEGRAEMFALGDRTVVAPAVVYAGADGAILTGEAAHRRAVSCPDRVA